MFSFDQTFMYSIVGMYTYFTPIIMTTVKPPITNSTTIRLIIVGMIFTSSTSSVAKPCIVTA